jgi:hypothetical protein
LRVRPVYRPRRPTRTPLYPVVQHHLETFLAQAAEADTLGQVVPVVGLVSCATLALSLSPSVILAGLSLLAAGFVCRILVRRVA